MELENILSAPIIQEANIVLELQKILCELNEDNFELSLVNISTSIFIESTERIRQFGHNIITILDNSIEKTDILFNLVLSLSHSLKESILASLLDYFIHNFITGTNKKYFVSSLARYIFIRLCCENKLIDVTKIIEEIRYWFECVSLQAETHLKLLIFFADYIILDDNLYQEMTKKITEEIPSKEKYLPPDVVSAYHDFKKMVKQDQNFDEIVYLSKNYYPKNSLLYYIKNDMLNEFCMHTSNENFNFRETFVISFYDPHRILHHSITYIEFAAFYGSIKIFKHLMAEFKSRYISIFDNKDHKSRLTYYAICGGNFEIIRLIFSEGTDANKSPKYATLYFRNTIYDWLLNDPESNFESVMHASCQVNNMEIFLETLKQGFDITKIHKGHAPIHCAALNGHCDILNILLTLPYVDVNCLTSENILKTLFYESPLHLAVYGRQIDAVRLLLNQPNINVNCQYKNSFFTPLHIAVRESNEEIVKLLLADKRIKITVINFVFLFICFIYTGSLYIMF